MVKLENKKAKVHSVFPTPVYVANLEHDLTPEMLDYLNNQLGLQEKQNVKCNLA